MWLAAIAAGVGTRRQRHKPRNLLIKKTEREHSSSVCDFSPKEFLRGNFCWSVSEWQQTLVLRNHVPLIEAKYRSLAAFLEGRSMMKRALTGIASVGMLALTVGVETANAQSYRRYGPARTYIPQVLSTPKPRDFNVSHTVGGRLIWGPSSANNDSKDPFAWAMSGNKTIVGTDTDGYYRITVVSADWIEKCDIQSAAGPRQAIVAACFMMDRVKNYSAQPARSRLPRCGLGRRRPPAAVQKRSAQRDRAAK
jgi:hypothetical protein